VANQPPATAIASEQLREKYSTLRANGAFGGSHLLYELGRLAWQAFDAESSYRRLICFALASVFIRLAQRQDGVPVTFDECAKLHTALDQPIIECIDVLTGGSANADPLQTLVRLSDAYAQVRLQWEDPTSSL
jgi:hypothetical protein